MCDLLNVNRAAVLKLFNKSEQSVKNDLKILREWLKHQPHLPEIDDARLERLLVQRKFSIERAKQTIDAHFTIRDQAPELFENRDPTSDELKKSFRMISWIPLKDQNDQYQRPFIAKIFAEDPKDIDSTAHIKYNFIMQDIMLHHDYSNGSHLIFDLKDLKLVYMTIFSPAILAKSLKVHMEAYGLRIAGLHIVFPPPFIDAVLGVIRSLLKEKLLKRVHIHKDLESLHKIIPKKILPKDYGGEADELLKIRDDWEKHIETWRPWLIKESKVRVDESKRPKESKTPNLLGSIHGTFKKLDID
ncbi:alpha-tocopherol transfer protein-like [Chrysoperla carnea]|uniref:alpha-tocopherol transfer protein-like n=1 Tax=Chrysoperla carnea TaxID=189513 RepID=UPI001D06DD1B|nr:alpha-tocopherol transfer protein-like [Chrysoperla carnea]